MMVLKLGWDLIVAIPVKDAVTVAEILSRALAWEENYDSASKTTIYHAYPCEKEITMKLVADHIVGMAQLAGKPEK
jgi:hypothetical protein